MSDRYRPVLVCGHEAGYGEALRDLAGPEALVVTGGRELIRALARLERTGERACVVPMTLGRDPELVADTARTLRALPPGQTSGTLLAEPFATDRHLIAWLRAAANRVATTSALLVTAPSGSVFDDAELYRIARLVQCHGAHPLVEVAFTGGSPVPAEGVRRCGLLGASRVTLLAAGFAPAVAAGMPGIEVDSAGPTVSRVALARILAERVTDARQRWAERQDDGIAHGLTAADDHGHNHTHPPGEGHDHGHTHAHAHPPGEGHGHTHTHAHTHPQGEGHTHTHAHTHPPGEEHDHAHLHGEDHSHGETRTHPHPHALSAGHAIRSNA